MHDATQAGAMIQIIGEWGGSAAIRIPAGVTEKMNLKKWDAVEIDYQNGTAGTTPVDVPEMARAKVLAEWKGEQSVDIAWLDVTSSGTVRW